jgi:hypothetical protein
MGDKPTIGNGRIAYKNLLAKYNDLAEAVRWYFEC